MCARGFSLSTMFKDYHQPSPLSLRDRFPGLLDLNEHEVTSVKKSRKRPRTKPYTKVSIV
jgi:hypothetical protein